MMNLKIINDFMETLENAHASLGEILSKSLALMAENANNLQEEIEIMKTFKRISNVAGIDFSIPKLETIFEGEILFGLKDSFEELPPNAVDAFLFKESEYKFSPYILEKRAKERIMSIMENVLNITGVIFYINPGTTVDVAFAAVNAAKSLGLSTTLMHYNADKQCWQEQVAK